MEESDFRILSNLSSFSRISCSETSGFLGLLKISNIVMSEETEVERFHVGAAGFT